MIVYVQGNTSQIFMTSTVREKHRGMHSKVWVGLEVSHEIACIAYWLSVKRGWKGISGSVVLPRRSFNPIEIVLYKRWVVAI
jgi:hypothetical protein